MTQQTSHHCFELWFTVCIKNWYLCIQQLEFEDRNISMRKAPSWWRQTQPRDLVMKGTSNITHVVYDGHEIVWENYIFIEITNSTTADFNGSKYESVNKFQSFSQLHVVDFHVNAARWERNTHRVLCIDYDCSVCFARFPTYTHRPSSSEHQSTFLTDNH